MNASGTVCSSIHYYKNPKYVSGKLDACDQKIISILDVWQINVRPDHKIITGKEGEPLAQREKSCSWGKLIL